MVFLSNGTTAGLCIYSSNGCYSIRYKALNNFLAKAFSKFVPLPVRPYQDQLASNRVKPSVTVFNCKIHSSTLSINLALKKPGCFINHSQIFLTTVFKL